MSSSIGSSERMDEITNSECQRSSKNDIDFPDDEAQEFVAAVWSSLFDIEKSYRHSKLVLPWWKSYTLPCFSEIVLQAVWKSIDCLERSVDNAIEIQGATDEAAAADEQRGERTCASTKTTQQQRAPGQNSHRSIAPDDLSRRVTSSEESEDEEMENDDPSVQYELEHRLATAADIQHTVTPLLIQFWQRVPTQLRQRVKHRVVESVCLRVSELQKAFSSSVPPSHLSQQQPPQGRSECVSQNHATSYQSLGTLPVEPFPGDSCGVKVKSFPHCSSRRAGLLEQLNYTTPGGYGKWLQRQYSYSESVSASNPFAATVDSYRRPLVPHIQAAHLIDELKVLSSAAKGNTRDDDAGQ